MLRHAVLCCAVAALVLALGGSHALAQSSASPLTWTAPSACPTGEAVLADVERLLARPIAEAAPPDFHVDVRITHGNDNKFHAVASFSTGSEPRNVEGESCDALTEALTVMITVAIDPNAELVIGEPLPLDVHNNERVEPPTRVLPPTPPFSMHGRVVPPFEVRIDLGMGVSHGALPGVGPGFGLGVSLQSYLFVAHAGVNYYLPRDESVGRFDMLRGELAGGVTFLPSSAPVWIELLLAAELASVHGQSSNIAMSGSGSGLWFGLGPSTRFRYQVGSHFGAFVALSAIFGIDRPQFDVSGLGTVWKSSIVDARAEVGVTLRFGS